MPVAGLEQPPAEVSPALAGVTIVVPAYNEGQGIEEALGRLIDVVRGFRDRIPAEIIVVDDGSSDDTAAHAERRADELVRVVRHRQNRGYGAAIKSGVHHARYDWIAITDADGTYPPDALETLLAERDSADMVVGARTGATRNIPLLRRFPKWVLRKLASYLSQVKIPDLNSGLRVMRKDLIERYERILPNQFSFTTTITLAMLSAGYEVAYLPIDYLKRTGKSKIRPIADTLNFLSLIVRTVMFFNPLRIFLPLAFLFLVASFGVGIGSYTITGKLMDVSTILLFVTSVQILALGMLADVINRRSP